MMASNQLVSNRPWAVLGDFNQTLNPHEGSQTSTRISYGMADFRYCLSQACLFDLSF